jgi:hypothetical protein
MLVSRFCKPVADQGGAMNRTPKALAREMNNQIN